MGSSSPSRQAPTGRVHADTDEILINTGLFHQFLMSAMLRDPSVADDQNLVGVLDGVQTVGDDQQGLPFTSSEMAS